MEFEGFFYASNKLMSCVMLFHLFTKQWSECAGNEMEGWTLA